MAVKKRKPIGLRTRLILISIPWFIWLVACFLPAYSLSTYVGDTVTGWTCFVFGPQMILDHEGWPWMFAWFANITMLLATVAYLVSYNVYSQRLIAGAGAAMSLLVLRFSFSDDGSSLQIAAYLWILANFILCYFIFRKNNLAT